jgi:Tol biopolymer transport system component/DNA-binding winged helix-turn-helix (wHTH) protein
VEAPSTNSRISFGLYELDLETGELWKAGHRVKLQSQPFKVLAMLLENPGKVVTREQLRMGLWGKDTVVDFEQSLGTAINKIRDALGDSADNPTFVQTLARRGYRFIAPVSYAEEPTALSSAISHPQNDKYGKEALAGSTVPGLPVAASVQDKRPQTPIRIFTIASLVVAAALAAGYFGGSKSSTTIPPHIVALTYDGHLAVDSTGTEDLAASVTDGSHLFVPVLDGGRQGIATVPVSGGDVSLLTMPEEVASPVLGDISPDGSRLLLRSHLSPESEQSLWVVPTSGDSALRIGEVLAHDATWMPDGAGVLYASGNKLYLTNVRGENPQVFATLPGRAFRMRWDPAGRLLRFTVLSPVGHTASLWQLSVADRTPRPIPIGFAKDSTACCGAWTADGRWFVFQSSHGGPNDLWKLSANSTRNPVRLTDGPLDFQSPVASRTGDRIFFLGVDVRSQLERLTPSGDLVPEKNFLAAAIRVEFSRDLKWVAWTDRSGQLWRATADGRQKLQLTPDALSVFMARWSPDGSRLAFMAQEPGKAWNIYVVPAVGGVIQPLLNGSRNAGDPSWSPDGESLVFGPVNDAFGAEDATRFLEILNLRTGKVSQVPGSEGLFSPRWSPDGRYIAALSRDQRRVRLFDCAAGTWQTLPLASGADPVWSADSHYLFVHRSLDPTQPIDRVSIPDGATQELVRLADSSERNAVDYVFSGLTQDNMPLVRARVFTGNIYSLDLR